MAEKEKNLNETKNLDKKRSKRKKAALYALQIFLWTFVLSLSFSAISELLVANTGLLIAVILLLSFIVINIAFDIIAVAVTSCSLEPFLAMGARRIRGAKTAVRIVKNAEKVANICGDVIGDICGILSGALGAAIVVELVLFGATTDQSYLSIIMSAIIAALTVGSKALGKKFAMDNDQKIIFFVARIFSLFSKE